MGWSSGSEIVTPLIKALLEQGVTPHQRFAIYDKILPAFYEQDWDTEDECLGIDIAFDVAALYPPTTKPPRGMTRDDLENFRDDLFMMWHHPEKRMAFKAAMDSKSDKHRYMLHRDSSLTSVVTNDGMVYSKLVTRD